MILAWLLTFGLDIIFPILGIVAHFTHLTWLFSIAITFIVYRTIFQHLSLFTIILHIISCIVGLILALTMQLPILNTIMLSICIEWLLINVISNISAFITSSK